MEKLKVIEWVLRVGLAGEFLGNGINTLSQNPEYTRILIGLFPFTSQFSSQILLLIGINDFVVAILAIVFPFRLLLIWALFCGFATAIARPIVGEPIQEFILRFPNFAIPLALLMLRGMPKNWGDLFK